jgi:hypothetical protein
MALSVGCPGCGEELTAKWLMYEGGLACKRGCGASRKALAEAVAAKYPHACYVFSDGITGKVKYVGVSTRLPERLVQHAAGRLMHDDGAAALTHEAKTFDAALERAGEDFRVALHGCELAWWFLLRPSENLAVPGHECSGKFRKLDGAEYEVRGCTSQATQALDLETLHVLSCLRGERGGCSAHMVMPSCGVLATTDEAGRRDVLMKAQAWHRMPCREMRKRCCKARRVAHGYCKCRVPCDPVCWPKRGVGEEEVELEVAADADDDEETRMLVEQVQWLGGCRQMMDKVAERRACRFYGEKCPPSAQPQPSASQASWQDEEEPWRLAPLRRQPMSLPRMEEEPPAPVAYVASVVPAVVAASAAKGAKGVDAAARAAAVRAKAIKDVTARAARFRAAAAEIRKMA